MDLESGKKTRELCTPVPANQDRCLWLSRQGVDVLVCGAISNQLQTRLEWMNIRVYPFVAGDISKIVKAWVDNSFKIETFAMPGCCCRIRGEFHVDKEVNDMRGRNQGQSCPRGRGQGQGQGQGRNTGPGTGPQGAGGSSAAGVCRCPSCGHEEPHERGVPCLNKKCPQCGEVLRGRV